MIILEEYSSKHRLHSCRGASENFTEEGLHKHTLVDWLTECIQLQESLTMLDSWTKTQQHMRLCKQYTILQNYQSVYDKPWNNHVHILMVVQRETELGSTVQRFGSERKDASIPRQQLPNLIRLMYVKWRVFVYCHRQAIIWRHVTL